MFNRSLLIPMKIRCLTCEFDIKDSAASPVLYSVKTSEMLRTLPDMTANYGSEQELFFLFNENCLQSYTAKSF